MRIKFNKFERVAGIFVLTAIVGSLAVTVGIAIQKGWLSSKVKFETTLDNAEGIHAGTLVQVAGLRAGSVTDVELISAEEIRVKFEIFEKFHKRIREDSYVQVIRPFIIGEKVLEIGVGSEDKELLEPQSVIASKPSFDIMDLVSGRKLGPFFGSLEGLVTNMKMLAEAFADTKRTKAFVKVFDRLEPLVKNMNAMSTNVVKLTNVAMKEQRLQIILSNLAKVSTELNQILPVMAEEAPDMARQIPLLVKNLTILSEEFTKLTPAITAVAPDLPRASIRAVEALDEAVILLKAMQKSFLLSGKVEDVKKEEAEREKRKPASEGK